MNPSTPVTPPVAKPLGKQILYAAIALYLGWTVVLAGLVLTSSEKPRNTNIPVQSP
ncbi:MAG: hypothetical protein NT172_07640 [Planctomycetota bacterium]|nr:hypothetical protein [Planctomycetota bacterium]